MMLSNKTLAIYYHMPFIVEEGRILGNPVIGTFVESLLPYFRRVIIFGFECVVNRESITYPLPINDNLEFVSLGPEGQFRDHFTKISKLKRAVKPYRNKIQILLLRVPSQLAYAVWKYADKPDNTALLFIGNPFFTPASSNTKGYMYLFRKIRSELHDRRMKIICRKSSAVVFANSQALVDLWSSKLNTPVSLIHTSSISKNDIITTKGKERFTKSPYRLLFVGRVCYDKGIRELFRAVYELNRINEGGFIFDIVGAVGDLGGLTLEQLAESYGVTSDIFHHGFIPFGDELFQYYRNADAFILPSYHEGMPKTVWEAMSQGTPVIASEIDGIEGNFTNGEDILFIQPRDPGSIVDAVMKLCNSQDLVKKLRENGLNRVKRITRETQAEGIIELLKAKAISSER
jgi:glycosyltransferase involved in cell wall biosynthesis